MFINPQGDRMPTNQHFARRSGIVPASVTAILIALVSGAAGATPLTVSASNQQLAASAVFDVSGNSLVITLTNTSSADALVPADVLTGLFFNIAGSPVLVPSSAALGGGSAFVGGSGTVGAEWAFGQNLSQYGAAYGLGAAGFGLFSKGSFASPGDQLQGIDFGLLPAGDNTATGNGGLTGNVLIKDSVVFTLTGLPAQFNPSAAISNVTFQYGSALSEGHFGPGSTPLDVTQVPEPATLVLLGTTGLLGLSIARRRKRR
jgi:hypothetical protein